MLLDTMRTLSRLEPAAEAVQRKQDNPARNLTEDKEGTSLGELLDLSEFGNHSVLVLKGP